MTSFMILGVVTLVCLHFKYSLDMYYLHTVPVLYIVQLLNFLKVSARVQKRENR